MCRNYSELWPLERGRGATEMIQMCSAFSSKFALVSDPLDKGNETSSLYISKYNLQYKTHTKNTQQLIVCNVSIQSRLLFTNCTCFDPVLSKNAEKHFGKRYLIFGNCNCSTLLLRRERKTNSSIRTRKSTVIHEHRSCSKHMRVSSCDDGNISTLLWHRVFNFVLDIARNTARTTLLVNRQGLCAAHSEGICRTKLSHLVMQDNPSGKKDGNTSDHCISLLNFAEMFREFLDRFEHELISHIGSRKQNSLVSNGTQTLI